MKDIIRRMRRCGALLTVWDTHKRDSRGMSFLGYRLSVNGKTIFSGEDFAGSPLHADDSDETVGSLLGFLTLKPGDTDADYFSKYTSDQIDWCQSSQAEELAMEAMAMRGELSK